MTAMTTTQIALERKSHDPGFVLAREAARHRYFRRLRWESEPDVFPDAEYVSPGLARDLEREDFSRARKPQRSRRPGAEFQVEEAFDGESIAPEIVAHALPRQVEQASLLHHAGGKFKEMAVAAAAEGQLEQSILFDKRAASFRAKAKRQAWCGIVGHRMDCSKPGCGKKLFKPHDCGLRYCPRSGPKAFRELYLKHIGRLSIVVEDLLRHRDGDCRPRVIAQIDITRRNTGRMPSPDHVRAFNKKVRKLFRRIERELGILRRDYGFAWMDEFGSGNSNLHAHGVYVGPYLPQKLLSQWWHEITGDSFIISIKAASSFEKALSHALKYPSKFWDAPPERLVELEKAFHKIRRFHALARFYNPPETRNEPGMESDAKDEAKRCPFCGSHLRTPAGKRGWAWVSDLRREGRIDLEEARIAANRAKAFTEGTAPP
jgi:hypothetical protein